ncbi:hypothetical protein R1flu_002903 [Riccia fluitans]|uniref:Uncharacterized protein n=1 Tax=Riccia fluitans TaxID=41844 RepID=A0ABD1Y7N5_9MARC
MHLEDDLTSILEPLNLVDNENNSVEVSRLLSGYESVLLGVRNNESSNSSNDLMVSVEGYDGPTKIMEDGNKDAYFINNSYNNLETSVVDYDTENLEINAKRNASLIMISNSFNDLEMSVEDYDEAIESIENAIKDAFLINNPMAL